MSIENRDLKPETVLVAAYPARGPKRKEHRCEVVAGEEGKVRYRQKDGREFASPSAAGTAVMGGSACNGWRLWTVEGADKPARAATKSKKAASSAKATSKSTQKAKGGAKAKKGATRAGKAANPSKNGAEPSKTIACGDCGQEFPDARGAAEHMRDEHGSPEAAGSGGR
ncbi:MAG: hypothetical protein A2Z17_04590 [Gammaproteobacteria bacterium RBG_16_66_13]|nr:MAG: hypothetical protein A2Z17_04590 [Gammaproteobacteria bacterium RBG_16_66_13]